MCNLELLGVPLSQIQIHQFQSRPDLGTFEKNFRAYTMSPNP